MIIFHIFAAKEISILGISKARPVLELLPEEMLCGSDAIHSGCAADQGYMFRRTKIFTGKFPYIIIRPIYYKCNCDKPKLLPHCCWLYTNSQLYELHSRAEVIFRPIRRDVCMHYMQLSFSSMPYAPVSPLVVWIIYRCGKSLVLAPHDVDHHDIVAMIYYIVAWEWVGNDICWPWLYNCYAV